MQITALLGCLLLLTACARNVEDQTRGKQATDCPLHSVRMQKAKVPIEYGLLAPEPNYRELWKARETLFPHAAEPVSGGCCVSDDMPLDAWIWACPECERARKQWVLEHGER